MKSPLSASKNLVRSLLTAHLPLEKRSFATYKAWVEPLKTPQLPILLSPHRQLPLSSSSPAGKFLQAALPAVSADSRR